MVHVGEAVPAIVVVGGAVVEHDSCVCDDLCPVEESAIAKEDAEGIITFDNKSILLPRLSTRMGQNEHAPFREADPLEARHKLGRAVQPSEFACSEVADAADD